MAIRVQNGAAVNFGTLATETTITHARMSYGGGVVCTRPLTTPRTIAAGGQAEFAIGEIDIVFPANQLVNAGYNNILADAFDGTHEFNVDAMTDAVTVVSASGYAQQAEANWNLSSENDP